jgi:hypothetical protein
VAALVLEAGFVARVRFVEPALQVAHRGAAHVLVEARLEIGEERVADQPAEPLDGADARERRDDRLADTVLE